MSTVMGGPAWACSVTRRAAARTGVASWGPAVRARLTSCAMGDRSAPEDGRWASIASTRTVPPPQNGSCTEPGQTSRMSAAQSGCMPAG